MNGGFPWWAPRKLRGFSRKHGLWCPYGCRGGDDHSQEEELIAGGFFLMVLLAILLIVLNWILGR